MTEILFVLNSKRIDLWIFDAILKISKTLHLNLSYKVLYEKNQKQNIFLNFVKKLSKKKYSYKTDAFRSKLISDISVLSETKICKPNTLIINITGIDITNHFSTTGSNIIEFRYGKELTPSYKNFGFREIQNKQHLLQSSIYLIEGSDFYLIQRTYSALHNLAFQRSLNEHFLKQAVILERSIVKYLKGEIKLNKSEITTQSNISLSLFKLFFVFCKVLSFKLISGALSRKKRWIIHYSFNKNDEFKRYKILCPSESLFWADPFIWKQKNTYQLFIEEKKIGTKKGYLSVIDLNNKEVKAVKIIEEGYHLSYPFIFEYRGFYYIIPESSENNTINLYQCIEYPYKWKFVKYLKTNIKAADTTLFEYNNKWWIFTNIQSKDGASIQDELFLFYADSPITNKWISHCQNPIVSDIRSSRPAGRIFIQDGKIFRPSQNSAQRYGQSVILNEILILTKNEYLEKETKEIKPWKKGIDALHTYNHFDELTVIDTFQ